MNVPRRLLLVLTACWLAGAQAFPAAQGGDDALVVVELSTVGLDRRANAPVVLLRDPESGTVTPIWVGVAEAQAIARALHGIAVPRPMTHDLMASLVETLKATVQEVVVHDLRNNVYFGTIRLRVAGDDGRTVDVDSRPSDALALALRTGARIRIARKLLIEPPDIDFVAPDGPEQVVHVLGITVVAPTDELRQEFDLANRPGVVVTHVFGRARDAGVQRGDLIDQVNEKPIRTPVDLFEAVRAVAPGGSARIRCWRDGRSHEIDIPVNVPPSRPPPGGALV
jgi:bifunctional DNase/RNase